MYHSTVAENCTCSSKHFLLLTDAGLFNTTPHQKDNSPWWYSIKVMPLKHAQKWSVITMEHLEAPCCSHRLLPSALLVCWIYMEASKTKDSLLSQIGFSCVPMWWMWRYLPSEANVLPPQHQCAGLGSHLSWLINLIPCISKSIGNASWWTFLQINSHNQSK